MIHICIPCRDEDRTIGVLLWKIRDVMATLGRDFHVFVLDDASRDGTRALLEKYKRVMPLTVLTERRPIGFGRATEKLLRAAAGRTRYPKRDAIITMQGDFTEHPEHLHALIKTFEGGADIVAGESATVAADVPRRIRFVRWLGGLAIGRMVSGDSGGDWLAGLRAYRVVVVKKAIREAGDRRLVRTDGWAANAELMKVLTPYARRVAHVPLTRRYDLRPRRTRVRILPTLRQILRLRKAAPLEAERHGAA
ncbi:MAG: glycosyltransferase [Gemmatimonadetes bacterium]|nr:glycosyltransferase [Gemmatimonadota bacterium]